VAVPLEDVMEDNAQYLRQARDQMTRADYDNGQLVTSSRVRHVRKA
jgi:hypothetical protein